ncbi:hypothetical protein ACHAWU_002982 [Discostella pseudostelligera]|uniref:Uncharacterized protein n=1 Tax=Discostella pseudostelligera TaxID=259834 RepID=A0ABD3LZH4_9STRA
MGNPRRDAIEYGVLLTLTASMAAAYAVLIAYSNQRTPDGQRRKLPRVELDKPVDLGAMWAEMKDFGRGTLWRGDQQQQQQQQRPSPGSSASNDISSTGNSNNNNASRGMDDNADRQRK